MNKNEQYPQVSIELYLNHDHNCWELCSIPRNGY